MRPAQKDPDSPTWSIITPSFRASDWLKLCIASVADQNISLEHIVQDSCSDDGTREWLAHDPRVTAIFEKDSGMYDGINRGLRRARGELIAYLNCDEQYLPGTLRQVVDYFALHPAIDVLFGDAILINAEGTPISYRRTTLPTLSHLRVSTLNTLTCATFFRRRLVTEGHLFPVHLKIAGDQLWIFELLKAGVRMAILPKPLSVFTFTGANLSTSREAAKERYGWLPKEEKAKRWMAPIVVPWHRLRKLFAGAYHRRTVTIEIFTPNQPHQRCRISLPSVGFRWPQLPAT